MDIKKYIREIPDWPKPGINFKDITPLLQQGEVFKYTVKKLAEPYENNPPDLVVGIDARGFVFAAALAYHWGCGMVLIRKKGKLPFRTIKQEYTLEYGSDVVEMHIDAISAGQKVVLVDDLLATGGTMGATVKLVQKQQAQILGISFVIDLTFLHPQDVFGNIPYYSLIQYDRE